ncbi:sensor histidine kinase [[Eubacterium] hominis]|uniref:histidine kinase n=1 Tax=[Eubacterium] hominis TaxID=2764325 RepID=A0A7G9GMC6_9FIRM|nr:sensor histidine kinase [[Eubacterium] hominis]
MKQNKFIVMFYFLLISALVEYFLDFDVYVMIILMSIGFGFLWLYLENTQKAMQIKENLELQEEIKSTAKDAHLKNKQLLAIVGSIPFPMLLMDQFGNIVMHNNLSEISLDMPFQDDMSYLNNNFVRPISEFIKDAFILEKPLDKIMKVNGVEYQGLSVPVTAKKKYSGCLILFQDISKTLEGEKIQKRFIADASHELKTPIAVIKGMVEILNRDDFDDEPTRIEFMKQIEVEINRLDVLVKDLLQLSRLSMSNPILERRKINICEIIQKCIHSLEKQAEKKGLSIICDFHSQDEVYADPGKMQQVIVNLLSNAIKYSDSGTITLRTKNESPYYIIEVEDQGAGLNEYQLSHIFERFYRVDDDRSRKSGGSGLGLPIVKGIIDAHGGKLEVHSTPGKGTTFSIKLKN